MDARPETFWSNNTRQKEGQWYCLDHGTPISINNISLVMGGSRHNDYPEEIQFEVSDDAMNWQPVGAPQHGNMAIVDCSKSPIRARYVRFRITRPRKNWLSICDFAVNRTLPPYVSSTVAGRNFTAYSNTEDIGINRIMEVFPIRSGEGISLELPHPIRPEWLEINLENADMGRWADIILTLESGEEIKLEKKLDNNRFYLKKDELPAGRITSLSLTNRSNTAQDIKITLFRIGTTAEAQATDPRCISDADIATTYFCAKAPLDITMPVPEGTSELITVGNVRCGITNATLTSEGEHVRRYKLAPGAKSVRITHPQQAHSFVNEVIFK